MGDGIKAERPPKSLSADRAVGGAAAAWGLSSQLIYGIANCGPPFARWDVAALRRLWRWRVGDSRLVLSCLHGPEAALFWQTEWSQKITSDHTVDLMPRAQLLLLSSGGNTRK